MRRLFAMLAILGMLMLPACDIFTKPGGGPDEGGGGGGEDTGTVTIDSFTVVILLDSVQLPDSIAGYTLWDTGPWGVGQIRVFDQAYGDTLARETAFVGVGVWFRSGGLAYVVRDESYVGSEGSDTLFVGYAPAPYGPLGWTPPEVPDTLDLRWFCLTMSGASVRFYTLSGDTIHGIVNGSGILMDSLLDIWVHDRANYPWWRPFVLTDDTLVIAVGGKYVEGASGIPLIVVDCLGNNAGLYYRIVQGGQEVALP